MEKTDNRGMIKGLLNFGNWEEINYVETNKGEMRGGHYHKYTEEAFYIIEGLVKVVIKNIENGEEEQFVFKTGDLFLIQPGELHTFYIEDNSKRINVLSKKMDENNPDFYK